MKSISLVLAATIGVAVLPVHATKPVTPAVYRQHPALLEQSKKYSVEVISQRPEAGILLQKLGLKYLHQLDTSKIYRLNLRTGAVTTYDKSDPGIMALGLFVPSASINSPTSTAIVGNARMRVWCPLSGQLAEVSGFMASTVSRDPSFGVRNGALISDTPLESTAQVDFSILKVSGGAKNPQNRTVLEATYEASCGDDVFFDEYVGTWPGLRLSMVIDDTGSMSNELQGVKSALASFIGDQGANNGATSREVFYELITFKDAPSLRLSSTNDTAAALAAVQSIYPSGGGDCPEDAIGGLSLAVGRAATDDNTEGAVVLVTDASPRGGDINGLISAAQAAGIKVHVMLSGDCVDPAAAKASERQGVVSQSTVSADSARQVFARIAEETGGSYYYMPAGSAQDYANVLREIFAVAHAGDDEPPTVTVVASPGMLWPANHKLVPIRVVATAIDNVDPKPVVTLESITSSEPDNSGGDGDTSNDIQITDEGIFLRAERNGGGPGRIYTIKYRAIDSSGNVGFGEADIIVPHDQR